jgi:hypothetical protein
VFFLHFLRLIDKKLTESEAAQRITENFGYTDATTNNIVKADAHSGRKQS